ncbi:F-box-like protein [Rhizoctonia solani]|uniref:F-box-like protein n=1 Tax=Rhizoctonia solani TaxID=456999 RepID=A0A8H8NVU2_9AGAM|nr:F-box-like protein [Rhizoctonia solani]QRW20854.1 F-box-like protein [Rhizoctonia solani]
MPLPSSHSAPYQAVSPAVSPPPLLPSKSAASGSSTPTAPSAMSPRDSLHPQDKSSPPPSQPTTQVNTAASQPPQVPVSAPPPPPKKPTEIYRPAHHPLHPPLNTVQTLSLEPRAELFCLRTYPRETSTSTQESKNASGQLQEPKAGGVNAYESSVSSIRKVSQLPAVQPSDPRTTQVSDVRKGQVSDVRDRRASQFPDPRPSYSSEARPSYRLTPGRVNIPRGGRVRLNLALGTNSLRARSESATRHGLVLSLLTPGLDAPRLCLPKALDYLFRDPMQGVLYIRERAASVLFPKHTPATSKSVQVQIGRFQDCSTKPRAASTTNNTTTMNRPGPSPHPPSSLRENLNRSPTRAIVHVRIVLRHSHASRVGSRIRGPARPYQTRDRGTRTINTSAPRSQSPRLHLRACRLPDERDGHRSDDAYHDRCVVAHDHSSIPSSTPQRGLLPPRAVSPTFTGQRAPSPTGANRRAVSPTPSNRRAVSPAPGNRRAVSPAPADRRAVSPAPTTRSESDESVHAKKRNLLVKTRKIDGASSFRSSDERASSERPVSVVAQPESWAWIRTEGGNDPFARAPPTIVKTPKRTDQPSKRTMPLSPPLSSDDHDTRVPNGLDVHGHDRPPMTPALTDEAPAGDEMNQAEPDTTTPPGSPPPPKIYPLETHLNMPSLIAALLPHLSFRDWNALNALNAGIRRQLEDTRALREEVLEYWLRGVGYARWKSHKREPVGLTLRDLNAYMRGVSIAVYRYSAIAESFLAVRAQQEQTKERVPGAASKGNLVRALASSCRAYTKVILRLREQAECMHPDGDFRSPLFKSGGAPLLRVFVPSKEGAWLSDASVLDCEKELKRAGALGVLRIGDVIWDAAVGEGNAGRMVWGMEITWWYDLDYTYSTTGELPKYIHSLAFSPSYWHKIIRTSNSPLCHIDLTPYAAEIARNIQLVQDRVQTETHTVVRWVHRSRFQTRSGLPIPSASPPATVDRMWDGYIVVEVEGTNEGLADLQARVGNSVRLFPAKTAGMEFGPPTGKSPFRLLRSSSRPGEIWIRAKLSVASNRLRDALDEYLAVCGGIERAVEEDPTGALIDPTDYISCELDMVNSYAETIDKAKAKIKRVRNWSSAIAINRLPIEILMQIFEWGPFRALRQLLPSISFANRALPKQPELLSHVCSRWRNILLSSPQFWTHIDFNFWAADYQRLYDRAERHLARAGEHPVRVHHIFSISRGIEVIPRPINPFIAAASQAYAIEAEIQVDLEFAPGQLYDSLLHACFHGCVPGKLNEVFVSLRPTGSRTFAYIDEHHIFNPTSNEENIFSSVTSLWMDGLYLPWTSSAYRGLVKLVLLRFSTISIPESELMTILSGCPGLQKLHLDINIIEDEPLSNSHGATSVYLYDLHDLLVTETVANTKSSFPKTTCDGPTADHPGPVYFVNDTEQDDTFSDIDSSSASELTDETMSTLASEEAVEYFQELNGRMFPKDENLPIAIPTDANEVKRLMLHIQLKIFLGGNYVGPVDQILSPAIDGREKKVLDLITAEGSWVKEMANEFPHVSFTSVDNTPLIPHSTTEC